MRVCQLKYNNLINSLKSVEPLVDTPLIEPNEAKEFYLKGAENISYVKSKYQALEEADAMILLTEWKEFRSPDFEEISKLLKSPVIFDGRNQYNAFNLKEKGFEYYQIGRTER